MVSVPDTDLNHILAGVEMHLRENFVGRGPVEIIVRPETEARLRRTCFRGKSISLAGNFWRWHSPREMFSDDLVRAQFLEDLEELWLKDQFGSFSFTVTHESEVGWASTAPLINYSAEDLENLKLGRSGMARALRVKSEREHLRAPRTNLITLVFEFKEEHRKEEVCPVAIIHSIYPGPDVGELEGDVTEREGCVFFGWTHRGA